MSSRSQTRDPAHEQYIASTPPSATIALKPYTPFPIINIEVLRKSGVSVGCSKSTHVKMCDTQVSSSNSHWTEHSISWPL